MLVYEVAAKDQVLEMLAVRHLDSDTGEFISPSSMIVRKWDEVQGEANGPLVRWGATVRRS